MIVRPKRLLLFRCVVLAFFVAATASAQFQTGDVLLGMAPVSPIQNQVQPSIQVYSSTGALKTQIDFPTNDILEDLNSHNSQLFGISSGPAIYTASFSGILSGVLPPIRAVSFVFDAHGNLYVADDAALKEYDSSYQLLRTFSLPEKAWDIDLAADQCTMYYVSAPQGPVSTLDPAAIGRYNVCASQSLPQLPTVIPTRGSIGALRVLSGDEILLGTNVGVMRIRADGSIVRTYSGGPLVALDPDGVSFWEAGSSDRVRKLELASGNELVSATPYGPNIAVYALTVVGEPRAAVASPAAIPMMSEWLMAGLAITLSVLAVSALKR